MIQDHKGVFFTGADRVRTLIKAAVKPKKYNLKSLRISTVASYQSELDVLLQHLGDNVPDRRYWWQTESARSRRCRVHALSRLLHHALQESGGDLDGPAATSRRQGGILVIKRRGRESSTSGRSERSRKATTPRFRAVYLPARRERDMAAIPHHGSIDAC